MKSRNLPNKPVSLSFAGATAALIFTCLPSVAPAATITWDAPQPISGTADVSTEGVQFGSWAPYDGAANTHPVNGVTFQGNDTLGLTQNNWNGGGNFAGGHTTPDADYNFLLNYAQYSNSTTASVTINGNGAKPLTVGRQYLVQFWVSDVRNLGGGVRSETINGSASLAYPANGTGMGKWVIGRFTADASVQTLTMTANASAQVNLLQVRDVTPVVPSFAAYFSGASGTSWDTATTAKWSATSGGPYNLTWAAGSSTDAFFEGTAASVAVSGTVGVAKIGFTTDGYTLGGSGTLLLSGASEITTGEGTDTIGAVLDGVVGLTKLGAGSLVLTGANTLQGITTASEGTLVLSNNLALQNSIFNTDGFGVLDLSAVNTPTLGGLAGASGLFLPENVTSLTLNPPAGIFAYSGSLSGLETLSLVKTGAGTQVLSGFNSYSGGTFINAGILRAGNNFALGSAAVTLNGGTLSAAGGNRTVSNPIVVTGTGSSFEAPEFSDLFLAGPITGSATVTKTGPYSLDLVGDNSGFTGTLVNSQSNTFFTQETGGSESAAWVLEGGRCFAWAGATGDHTVKLGSLAGTNGNGQIGNNLQSGSGQITFEIGGNNASTTFSGRVVNTLFNSGTTALRKVGTGTLTLAGNNSHWGSTTVTGGTLAIPSTGALAFRVTDAASNKLTGTGTATIDGTFNIDTSVVTLTAGATWTLVDVATRTFAETTFAITGYTADPDGVTWTRVDGARTWTFSETSGLLTLPASPFQSWAQAEITNINPTADATPGGDPDGDGASNLDEFAFDGDPLSGTASGKVVGKVAALTGGNFLTLTLPVRNGATFTGDNEQTSQALDGVIYTIQGSDTDLADWALEVFEVTGGEEVPIQSGLPPLGSGWSYRTFRASGAVDSGNPSDFLRAQVEAP